MKKLILVLSFLTSLNAFCSGKFIMEGAHKFNQEYYHAHVASVGMAAYEPFMFKGTYLNTYAGLGLQDERTSATGRDFWCAVKADLDIKLGDFTVAPGATMKYLSDDGRSNNDVHVSVSYKLW